MATSEARELIQQYREQEASTDGNVPRYERQLFKRGGSIGVTLTATGRDVHGLTDDMVADVFVFSEGIVIVPGGDSDG